jgi:Pyruvate/2-oxoacid:ferredoxin oxidoreductase delta subunit
MSLADPALRIVLYEGSGASPLDGAERYAAVSALLERGYAVTRGAADRPVAPADHSPLLVLGRFAGQPPEVVESDVPLRFHDITALAPAQLGDVVENARNESGAAKHGAWKPWFPVIDYDRCTNCMQCLSFCLFGVYGVDADKQIQVQNNDNCKTNCPACSRVCPAAAIMFPKYKAGPINGDEVKAEDLQREKMKVDISALLGGDIYAALRQRSEGAKVRFAKERDEKRALEERKKCLAKLQEALDIPPEVMNALPSADLIRAKTEAALARAEE